jgi:heat-inducible transcriptional repressor
MLELTARRQRVLHHIVQEYVATAQPVASDLIARKYEADVSSATVRNDMAFLEDVGLIAQPHTSAGRVPTDRGYRHFVEWLMASDPGLSLPEQRTLRDQFKRFNGSAAESAHLASTLMARTLGSAAVATPPTAPKARLRRLELVPLQIDLVLVTLILVAGSVRQMVEHVQQALARADAARLSNEISEVLAEKTAAQARRSLGRLSAPARPFAEAGIKLLQQATDQAFVAIYYEGLAQLLSQPEFAQSEKLRPILEVLEHQPLLTRFLAEALATPGVQVMIGSENPLEQMHDAAVVLTRYGTTDDYAGVLGVLGPTRLQYWRAVPMVRLVAELMDSIGRRQVPVATGSGKS